MAHLRGIPDVLGGDSIDFLGDPVAARFLLRCAELAARYVRRTDPTFRFGGPEAEILHVLEAVVANAAKRKPSGSGDTTTTWDASASGSPAPAVQQVDDMLSASEVAAALGVTERRVRQRASDLGGVRVGREWRFPAGAGERKAS